MKRRDLLAGAGILALGTPAVRASALLKSNLEPAQSQKKDLIVAFSGPFCFWQESGDIKVMAPPVGRKDPKAPHWPWVGTTANTKILESGENYTLVIGGYVAPLGSPARPATGTPYFSYEQEAGSGASPLFNFVVPMPTQIIGVRPTGVNIVCKPGVTYPYCGQDTIFASGLSFLYKDVAVDQVTVTTAAGNYFKPCFINDEALNDATLGVHLTALDPLDPKHKHAKYVWTQMMSMYPWMQDDLTPEINFCQGFDPTTCPASCLPKVIQLDPSNDCQAPNMLFPPGGANNNRNRKK